MGRLPEFDVRLACSSAAGGLRMVAVGLVRELTLEAARQAALGAGARLVGSFAQRLTRADVNAIVDCRPDIVLLAGGTDGGNSGVIVANARAFAESPLVCPVVVAGTCGVGRGGGLPCRVRKAVIVTENVMPSSARSTSSRPGRRFGRCSSSASSMPRGSTPRLSVSTKC